ncbi:MAG: TrmH family RNA methyltransferase [Caulobacteraceae bacterium]
MSARRVTSLSNPAVKLARSLHLRKAREESGLFLAEGLRLIGEGLAAGRAPRLLIRGPQSGNHPILAAAEARAAETLETSEAALAKISKKDNPQAALGVFEQSFVPLASLDPGSADCWLALQGVRDPGNLGTIIRTLDAAGLSAVILIGETCDPFSVEAVRATMGSIFAVQIARTGLAEFLSWRAAWTGSVVGASLAGTTALDPFGLARPILLVMGSERAGLSAELAGACEQLVKIPMRGRADSLNLAVASGILLYRFTGA